MSNRFKRINPIGNLKLEIRNWKFPFPFEWERGQTLIEALAALAITAIIVTAISVLVTSSLNNSQFSKNENLATKYAQEGMEIVRHVRDLSYNQFRNYDGTYCLAKGATTLGASTSSCTTPNVDNYVRSAQIQQNPGCGPNLARVTMNVAWADSKCQPNTFCHKSSLVSCYSTVDPLPAP